MSGCRSQGELGPKCQQRFNRRFICFQNTSQTWSKQYNTHKLNSTKPPWRMRQTGFKYRGRCRWLDTGERDTGGHNEGGVGNHTGGNNQEQGRQSQGQEMQGNRGHERQGLQDKTQNKTQKLRIMTKKNRWRRPKCETWGFNAAVHKPMHDYLVMVTTSTSNVQSLCDIGLWWCCLNPQVSFKCLTRTREEHIQEWIATPHQSFKVERSTSENKLCLNHNQNHPVILPYDT